MFSSVKFDHTTRALAILAVIFLRLGGLAHGQSATGINGLYYTGETNAGGLVAGGTQESHWKVTYANTNGVLTSPNATYQGNAYVVSTLDSGWTANTAQAQWIVPPGAQNSGGTANVGGTQLPGNGTGNNEGIYVYTLAFQITGTGTAGTITNNGTIVTNQISVSLTISADDQYQVYVNPALNASGAVTTAPIAGLTGTAAWNNTQTVTLQNFGSAGANNSVFRIGTNYLTIVVDNTNSKTGNQSAALNASGLLVYQIGNAMTIDGVVVPEVGTWMPVVLGLGLFIRRRFFGRSAVGV